jgi:hypothetical protein
MSRASASRAAAKSVVARKPLARAAATADVALAFLEALDLGGIDVDADDAKAGVGETQHQRQPDVAQAEYRDHRAAVAALRDQRRLGRGIVHLRS